MKELDIKFLKTIGNEVAAGLGINGSGYLITSNLAQTA